MRPKGDGNFPTTQWTLIERLKSRDEAVTQRALEDLCHQYHYPLYCYLRRRGLAHHDAQDALHDFLARFLKAGSFATADAEKGRLRSFLSTCLGRFLANWHRERSRRPEVSSDEKHLLAGDEDRYLHERLTDEDTPDRLFDRKWAQALIQQVLARLEEKYTTRGKTALFETLRPVLTRGGSLRGEDSTALAQKLGTTEGALRTALNRLLRDYGTTLKEEVRQTVSDADEVEEELSRLRQIFGGK